jgi:tetratricopeptide (TPR) repeat protein
VQTVPLPPADSDPGPLGLFERWLQVVAQEPALAELFLVLLLALLGLLILGLLRRQASLLSQREALQDLFLGSEQSLAGDHEKAVERLQSVVERDPRNAEARLLLGNSLRALGRPVEAHQQHLEVSQVLRAGDRTATLALALDLMARGTPADALAPLEELLQRTTDDPEVLGLLITARTGAGLFPEAADAAERLRQVVDDVAAAQLVRQEAQLRLQAGEARLAQDRPDLAVAQLERAVALDPLLLPARAALVRALSRSGRSEAAAATLGAGLRLLTRDGGETQVLLPADTGRGGPPALQAVVPADPLALPAARAVAARWLVQREPYCCARCSAPRPDNVGSCPSCGSVRSATPAVPELTQPLRAVQEVMDEIEENRTHVRKLVRWLHDPQQRAEACGKLVELGERAVVECFDAAVRSEDRRPIADVLKRMGVGVLPALMQAFQSFPQRSGVLSGLLPGRSPVQALSELVRGFGPPALPFFQRWLGTEDRDLRKVVLDFFLGLREGAEIESLKHSFPAVEILLRINQLEPGEVEALAMTAEPGGFLAVLLSDQAFRQDEALLSAFTHAGDRTALGQVLAQRGFSPQIVQGLIEFLNEPRLRQDARGALARQGLHALDQLVAAFADQDRPPEARAEVRQLLLTLGTPAVRGVCACFGPDPAPLDGDVVTLLVAMGPAVLPELEEVLRPRGWLGWLVPLRVRPDHPRGRVVEAIGRIGGAAAREILARLLERETESRVRLTIEHGLRQGTSEAGA